MDQTTPREETRPAAASPGFGFDNSYARLPERFYARLDPTPPRAPSLVRLNVPLAEELGLDPAWLSGPEGLTALSGAKPPEGSEPLAMAYAGHQFGGFSPQLGDGRAHLLGEVIDRKGTRRDIHLKGSGPTPFSRRGDGRAALGPVLREFILSDAMHALGAPTTRSLAAVRTGEPVYRETALPGAVLTRVARSHVRIGTFEFFAAREDDEALRALSDYVIARHYPAATSADVPARALLDAVVFGTARLIAQWQGLGFIHGVMNTDNMSIACETIDYGPCAFMDHYDPATVYSSIDVGGRYAYGNQPRIGLWNLSRLAQCLLPLMKADENAAVASAQSALGAYPDAFEAAWTETFRAKLGLATAEPGDLELAQELLGRMAKNRADFTLTFRALADAAEGRDGAALSLFADPDAFTGWAALWRARLDREETGRDEIARRLRAANPAFIPRNHRVEQALSAALDDDLDPFDRLLATLRRPFEDQPEAADLALPPEPHEEVKATFCGT